MINIRSGIVTFLLLLTGCGEFTVAEGEWQDPPAETVIVYVEDQSDSDGDGVNNDQDCAPDDPFVSQATVEVCNGLDDDCDGFVDDEDSSVSDQGEWDVDRDKDGYGGAQIISCAKPEYPAPVYDEPDCDDSAPAVKPDGHEVCNDGIDQNCDGQDLSCADVDDDSDGWTENQGDCDDKDPQESPEKTGQYCN